MRVFVVFLVYLAVALLLAAALTHPLHWAANAVMELPLSKATNRALLLLVILSLVPLLMSLRLLNRRDLGFGDPARVFAARLGGGFVLGALFLATLVVALVALEVRVVKPTPWWWHGGLPGELLGALLSAFGAALTEEAFFRGALHSGMVRTLRPWQAVVLGSALYSALHFLHNPEPIRAAQAGWASGWANLAGIWHGVAALGHLDSALALFAGGVLLALLRHRTGSIAVCVGMHAGWVFVIKTSKEVTDSDPAAPLRFLVGDYDRVIGYLGLLWMCVVLAGWWLLLQARAARRTRQRHSEGKSDFRDAGR